MKKLFNLCTETPLKSILKKFLIKQKFLAVPCFHMHYFPQRIWACQRYVDATECKHMNGSGRWNSINSQPKDRKGRYNDSSIIDEF